MATRDFPGLPRRGKVNFFADTADSRFTGEIVICVDLPRKSANSPYPQRTNSRLRHALRLWSFVYYLLFSLIPV